MAIGRFYERLHLRFSRLWRLLWVLLVLTSPPLQRGADSSPGGLRRNCARWQDILGLTLQLSLARYVVYGNEYRLCAVQTPKSAYVTLTGSFLGVPTTTAELPRRRLQGR